MSKAYDRVKWIWLEKIVNRLGFDEKWRKLVMQCVTTITYSVRINGKPKGHIIPTRGIRQGNPLSPYLFLLRAEGLSSLIKKVVDDGVMEGLVIYQRRGGGGLDFLIYFLLMIVSFFTRLQLKSVTPYKEFSQYMKKLLDSN